jgi:type II secretory pathway component PulF
MFFSSRIGLKPLAQLCHRLDIATGAGIQDFKIWQDEAARGSRTNQRQLEQVVNALSAGNTLPQALATTGNYFPPLFHQMVEVGDISGQMDRTYKRLAEHYDHTLAAKRAFFSRLAWPALQFAIAVAVVGGLILIMGVIPGNKQGEAFDILGLGLVGISGFIKYCNVLVLGTILVLLVIEALRRGAAWTRPLQLAIVKIPAVGQAFKTLALARFTWAFQLVLGTSMDLRCGLSRAKTFTQL